VLLVESRSSDLFAVPRVTRLCVECHDLLPAGREDELMARMNDDGSFDQYGHLAVLQHLRDRGSVI
jgi:hypothetical protein